MGEDVRGLAGFKWLPHVKEQSVDGKFELLGEQMQILNVALGSGEMMQMEPGVMLYMGPGIKGDVTCSGCFKRCCGGEPCAAMMYTNEGSAPSYIGLTPAQPADIITLDMARYGLIRARSGAFISSLGGAQPSCEVDCYPPTCCCAGFGCIRQTISGDGGHAFMSATGTVERKALAAGETLIIDSSSLVAWHDATLGARTAGTCLACCCNGEGCFNTTLTGPGTAWIQTMPWYRFKAQMGVTVHLDKSGNVKYVGSPPTAEMHRD